MLQKQSELRTKTFLNTFTAKETWGPTWCCQIAAILFTAGIQYKYKQNTSSRGILLMEYSFFWGFLLLLWKTHFLPLWPKSWAVITAGSSSINWHCGEGWAAHLSVCIYNTPAPGYFGSNTMHIAPQWDSFWRLLSHVGLPGFSIQAHNSLQSFVTLGLTHSMCSLSYHNYQHFSTVQQALLPPFLLQYAN